MNSTVFNKELYVRQLHDNNLLNMKSTNNYFYQKICKFGPESQSMTKHCILSATNLCKYRKFIPALLVMLETFIRSTHVHSGQLRTTWVNSGPFMSTQVHLSPLEFTWVHLGALGDLGDLGVQHRNKQ